MYYSSPSIIVLANLSIHNATAVGSLIWEMRSYVTKHVFRKSCPVYIIMFRYNISLTVAEQLIKDVFKQYQTIITIYLLCSIVILLCQWTHRNHNGYYKYIFYYL